LEKSISYEVYESSTNILNYNKAEYGGKEDGCSPEGSAGYTSAPQLRIYGNVCVVEWVYAPTATYAIVCIIQVLQFNPHIRINIFNHPAYKLQVITISRPIIKLYDYEKS
jgi:hypothetical protein